MVKGEGGFAIGLMFMLWGLVPYIVCAALALRGRPSAAMVAAALCLADDALAYYSAFIAPQSSTAVLGFLVAPVLNLIIAIPIGLLVGRFVFHERQPMPVQRG